MAEESITPAARFYRLHRDEQLARKKEEYNNRPEVIAKREERRRKLAEKRRRRRPRRGVGLRPYAAWTPKQPSAASRQSRLYRRDLRDLK